MTAAEREPSERVRRIRIVIETDQRTINTELACDSYPIGVVDVLLRTASEKAVWVGQVDLWSAE